MIVCFALLIGCNLFTAGAAEQDGRIVGGEAATIEQHPYQVSIHRDGSHICGGSIISREWIVTAAHCMTSPKRYWHYTVRSGSTYHDYGGQLNDVQEIIVHEKYNTAGVDYDIAVIKLAAPLTFDATTMPITLATSKDYLLAGIQATVTGWGTLKPNGSPSRQLQRVEVPLVTRVACDQAYVNQYISERMLCAGYLKIGGKDACQGDSGGPLALFGKLIGVVSWGFGCAHPSYPGVYTRVTAVRPWIRSKTGV